MRGSKRKAAHDSAYESRIALFRADARQKIADHKVALDAYIESCNDYNKSIQDSNKLITEYNLLGLLFTFMKTEAKKANLDYIISRAIRSGYSTIKHGYREGIVSSITLKSISKRNCESARIIKRFLDHFKIGIDEAVAVRNQKQEHNEIAKNYEIRLRQIAQVACDLANNADE